VHAPLTMTRVANQREAVVAGIRPNPPAGGEGVEWFQWPRQWKGKLSTEAVVIGQGGHGKVYMVTVECDQSRVAVKHVRAEREEVDREVALMKLFGSHPNFLKYFGQGSDISTGGYREPLQGYYIMMELATGGTLRDVIDGRSPATLRQKYELFRGALAAVEQMHGMNLVHRDVKPENILVSGGRGGGGLRVAKLGDLGSACQMPDTPPLEGMLTCSGRVGTPYYVAPQGFLSYTIDPKNDVWALGMLLYELTFSCKPAALASAGNHQELKDAIMSFDIHSDSLFKQLGDGFLVKGLLEGMLTHDMHDRLSSAAALEMASALAMEPVSMPVPSLPECFFSLE